MPESVARPPLPRRGFLSGGAAFAATAMLAAPSIAEAATRNKQGAEPTSPVVVRWNSQKRAWGKRPADADFGVVFLSTNDPHATAPVDAHMQAGDVWRRHPDALEA